MRLMNAPFGPALVVGLGAVLIGLAAMEFVRAYSADFRKDLSFTGLGADLQRWIVRVGRMGFAARGVVFGLIGLFLIQASRHNDASEAIGLGGALQKLADQSHGADPSSGCSGQGSRCTGSFRSWRRATAR